MRTVLTLSLLVLLSASAPAEVVTLPIPNEGWHITFDAPHFESSEDSKAPVGYAFRANAGRFNLSAFIEKPNGGPSNKECYQFYWRDASRNPMIVKSSVAVAETPKFVRVQYDIETTFQGQKIHQRNVNYYFAYHGRWVDVHISIIEPAASDQAIFDRFDSGLSYGED
jgi:hypothetical protein